MGTANFGIRLVNMGRPRVLSFCTPNTVACFFGYFNPLQLLVP
jgi:hypothetical protein